MGKGRSRSKIPILLTPPGTVLRVEARDMRSGSSIHPSDIRPNHSPERSGEQMEGLLSLGRVIMEKRVLLHSRQSSTEDSHDKDN